MRLLICTQTVDQHDPTLGFFHEWIATFAAQVEQVHVICLREGVHSLPSNVSVHSLGKEQKQSRLHYLLNFYRYVWRNRHDYDAVFVHMNPEYAILGVPLWRLWGKQIALWYTHGAVNLKLRLATTLVHHIITASKESFRLTSKKVTVVGHGIVPASCTPVPFRDPVRLITVGRIAPVKGYDCMFDAMEFLASKGVASELKIIGTPATEADKVYAERLKAEAKARSLNVSWQGGVPHAQIPSYLCAADVFLNCSETGSLDKAVLEAMGAGLPVVTTNKGLASTLAPIDPEALVARDAAAIADRIAALTAWTPEALQALGARYRMHVRATHSLEALIERVIHIYTE